MRLKRSSAQRLKTSIKNQKAKIAVMGLGYVGLPLAVNFARKGFSVYGIDKDKDRIDRLKKRKNYITDVSTEKLKRVLINKKLIPTMDFSLLSEVDIVIVCVPTPLKRKYTPDISYIVGAVKMLKQYVKPGMLVVLESTTYPGTTRELIKPILEQSGLIIGRDLFLSFSPERIDPGNKNYKVTNIPKVVGGCTRKGGELTRLLYKKIIKEIHVVSSPETAEMTKLLENTFRIINIGWINELAVMCQRLGVDVWEVIDAAKTKPFGFMPFYPGLGVGGHCIPDDPLYLYWKAKQYGFNSKYIKLSADTNASMPAYVVGRITELLKAKRKKLSSAKILIVGVTYKKDVKDLRKSPPIHLIELFKKHKVKVDYFDPYIPYLKMGSIDLVSVKLNSESLKKYDCVVVATDHSIINYKLLSLHAKMVFDLRNVYAKLMKANIFKL